MLKLRFLGPPYLEGPDGPVESPASQRLRLALLARLAAARSNGVGRETLISALWPEHPSPKARHALSNALYSIRKSLGEDAITQRGDLLILDTGLDQVDVWQFRETLDQGQPERAVDLYRGPFLEGIVSPNPEFERWVQGEREQLARLHEGALETLGRGALSDGRVSEAARWYARLVRQRPLSSRFTAAYIRVLVAAGDEATALHQADLHAQLRRTELEAEPDPRIQAMADLIRSGHSTQLVPELEGPLSAGPSDTDQVRGARPEGEPSELGFPAPRSSKIMEKRTTRSVAVLPFVNHSADPLDQYFIDGVAEETIHALSLPGDLLVAARTSTWRYEGREVDVREVGRTLGVGAVVEGSVRRDGDTVRVTVRLIDTGTGYQLWSGRYDRRSSGGLAVQDEIAREVARECRAQLLRPSTPKRTDGPDESIL